MLDRLQQRPSALQRKGSMDERINDVPLARCPAVNAADHRCAWEQGHEFGRLPSLDGLLVLNGVAVHGSWQVPRWRRWLRCFGVKQLGAWEVWPANLADVADSISGTKYIPLDEANQWNGKAISVERDARGFWLVRGVEKQ